jgi:hypothetical protein
MAATIPLWARTIGASLEANAPIRVLCTKCKNWRELGRDDLAALVERVGPDYSLIGRRCRCRLSSRCNGWNRFYYQSAVFRPLWTDEDVRRWVLQD